MSEICEGLKTTAVIQINHMGRSAGDMNVIKKGKVRKKTACMWEECMAYNESVITFSLSLLNLTVGCFTQIGLEFLVFGYELMQNASTEI